jgi:hypothetical protein
MEKSEWPFKDPENVAVFTSKRIIGGKEWIYYVTHDIEDGAWQFHPYDSTPEKDGVIVSLKEIVDLDSTIKQLADLPVGWHAWRKSKKAEWVRQPR